MAINGRRVTVRKSWAHEEEELAQDAIFRLYVDPEHYIEAVVRHGEMTVRGFGALVIEPSASNQFEVKVAKP